MLNIHKLPKRSESPTIHRVVNSSYPLWIVYRKIPIITPGAYLWSKGLFEKNFLGGLIFGEAYTWTNICVLKTRFFIQAIVIF